MNVVLFGPPGAGKGTLASRLGDFDFVVISTGDLLRSEVAAQTELGLKVASIMEKGELVDDELMISIIANHVKDENKNYLLDGFPRNISQAQKLEQFFQVDKVANLDVAKEVLLKRILGRRVCAKCKESYNIYFKPPKQQEKCDSCGEELITRSDDNEESLSVRLENYYQKSKQVISYYKNNGKLVKIDASKTPEEIFKTVKNIFNF